MERGGSLKSGGEERKTRDKRLRKGEKSLRSGEEERKTKGQETKETGRRV